MGAKILLLSNNPSSPIIKNTDFFFDMNTSKETSVAATKTYILSLVNIIKLVAITANQQEILLQLNHLPENIEKDKINDWDYKIIDKSISKGFIISRGMGFALSTAGGIIPITKINGKNINNGKIGKVTSQLKNLYWEKHTDPQWSQSVDELI